MKDEWEIEEVRKILRVLVWLGGRLESLGCGGDYEFSFRYVNLDWYLGSCGF